MNFNKLILITFLFLVCACFENQPNLINKKSDIELRKIKSIKLSKKLSEISGLAYDNGRLFCHQDEKGIIYELDIDSGEILKKFYFGKQWAVEADFEGIAIVNNRFFTVTNTGLLYEFKEAENSKLSGFIIHKTGLSSSYNVEGLCYDSLTNSLLLACKEYPGKKYKGNRAVYSYSLSKNKLNKEPRFLINLNELKKKYGCKSFYPSGIEKHPDRGSFFIISSRGDPCLLELSEKGDILGFTFLNKSNHEQPEGITFLPDGSIIISDEKVKRNAKLTIYKFED